MVGMVFPGRPVSVYSLGESTNFVQAHTVYITYSADLIMHFATIVYDLLIYFSHIPRSFGRRFVKIHPRYMADTTSHSRSAVIVDGHIGSRDSR